MMRRGQALLLAAVVGLSGSVPSSAAAQDPARMQQQQQQMMMRLQEQVQHLNRVMERVSGVEQRAQQMEREMVRSMERLQQDRLMAEENAVRLRNQERLRSMAQSMTDGATEMHRAMTQFRSMLQDPGVGWDPEMERQMEQLREHWDTMAGQMEESLQIMDRLRERLGQLTET
ncbi:MAG: hypothetical protein P8188_06105 [Gemmatimonadota bacterium]|jgi:hypothetical protein